jgi:hypothetical protein
MSEKWRKRFLSDPRGGSTAALECPYCHALIYPDEWPGPRGDGFNAKDKHAEWHLKLQTALGVQL